MLYDPRAGSEVSITLGTVKIDLIHATVFLLHLKFVSGSSNGPSVDGVGAL